jgi:hypothetical protein
LKSGIKISSIAGIRLWKEVIQWHDIESRLNLLSCMR